MNKTAASVEANITAPKPKEKILFDIQPLMLPTILNLENLTMIGFTLIIVVTAVIFHFGISEFIIVGALYLLIAVPSFNSIFRAGSTSYVLTNQRVVIFTLRMGSKERSIPLEQIQDVKIKTSGLQKFYGAGDIIIYQKALRKPVRLSGIKDCKRRTEQIIQAVKKAGNQI